MKFVQRLFVAIGGLGAAAALLTIVSPKAHALVATLVEVVNTASNPVINQDRDSQARNFYQFEQSCSGSPCSLFYPAVPTGKRLIIQHVSVTVVASAADVSSIRMSGSGTSQFLPVVLAPNSFSGQFDYLANEWISLYLSELPERR